MEGTDGVRTCPLFGGALSAALPRSAVDVSGLREVPDNQEVFAHPSTDQSLIVELLEYQQQVDDQHAATYHFEDIASSNKALGPGALQVTHLAPLTPPDPAPPDLVLSACSTAWVLTGTQRVSKFNEEAENNVTLNLGLFRLPQFGTDVLVTFNDPQSISPHSSSAGGGAAREPQDPWTLQDFQLLLQTLTLHDPGLFC